jgi:hypothetical protein
VQKYVAVANEFICDKFNIHALNIAVVGDFVKRIGSEW